MSSSQNRRSTRGISKDLEGPASIYEQLRDSMFEKIMDEACPMSYQELLNHYSKLWQEYCDRINTKREYKKKTNIEPRFFYKMNRPIEKESESNRLFLLIRRIAVYPTNIITFPEILIKHDE